MRRAGTRVRRRVSPCICVNYTEAAGQRVEM